MIKIKNLIIGGGISGLAFANFCKSSYMIIEKDDSVGGLCRTFYQGGYVWDYAGHFFHFTDAKIKRLFNDKISKEDLVFCKKNTKIYYGDIFVDYPFQMNIHQLPKADFIDCLYDLFHRLQKDSYCDFQEMLYGKFGEGITERFLKPYNEKLYACNLVDLDVDAMGRFFPYAEPEQIIDNMKNATYKSYNSVFEYPKKGAFAFVEALLNDISSGSIRLNTSLFKLDIDRHMATICSGGEYQEIHYDNLINTIPLNAFISCIDNTNSIIIKDILSQENLHSNKVLVFNIGFDKKSQFNDIHWIYFPSKEINFYRVGFYDNILGGDKLSLYVEIGLASDDNVDIDDQFEKTIKNLKKTGIISDHKVIEWNHVIMSPGYVHISSDSKKSVYSLEENLKRYNVYTIGRYGKWTYCSIEDCIKMALNLADELN